MTVPYLPEAILFDLDDTILDAYHSPHLAWRAVLAEFAEALGGRDPAAIVNALDDAGRIFWSDPQIFGPLIYDMRAARRKIVAHAFAALDIADEALGQRLADRFTDYRNEEMKPFPGAIETIDRIKAQDVKLALITNGGTRDQREKLTRFGLEHRFDHIAIAEEVGWRKPDPEIFAHATDALGVSADACWMVGDHLEWDIAGAQAARIGTAIWHDHLGNGLPDGSAIRPDRVIARLAELLE